MLIFLGARECFRLAITFCRGRRRMDSYCLLDLHQHHQAAQLYSAWDSKIGLRTGINSNDIIYPLDGQEVLLDDDHRLMYVLRLLFPAGETVRHALEANRGTMYVFPPKGCIRRDSQVPRQVERLALLIRPLAAPCSEWTHSETVKGGGVSKYLVLLRIDEDPYSVAMQAEHHLDGLPVHTYRSRNVTVTRLRPEACRLRAGRRRSRMERSGGTWESRGPHASVSYGCLPSGWEGIRVYEVLLLTDEPEDVVDLLEIRLQELAPVVHRFVIVEYDITWEGKPRGSTIQTLLEGPQAHRWMSS